MKPRFTVRAALVMLPMAIALFSFAQDTPHAQRINIEVTAPLIGYMNSASSVVRANTSKGMKQSTMLDIPTLDIYNPAGQLIYHGTGETKDENRKVLEGLPDSVVGLKRIPDRAPLKPLLEILPETHSASNALLTSGHYVIYAVSLLLDRPTTTQTALAKVRSLPNTLPVDIVSIRLKQ